METVAALAFATGRTLVIPPAEAMYLISKKGKTHSFGNFFPLEDLERPRTPTTKDPILEVISMHAFLERELVSGAHLNPLLLRRGEKGGKTVVPQDHLDSNKNARKAAWEYLRNPAIALQPLWKPNEMALVIPSRPGALLSKDRNMSKEVDKALHKFQSTRKKLVEFDIRHQNSRIIHLASDYKSHRRLLTVSFLSCFPVFCLREL